MAALKNAPTQVTRHKMRYVKLKLSITVSRLRYHRPMPTSSVVVRFFITNWNHW